MRSAPLGLTMGDPSGIGLDLSLKAWCRRDELNLPSFIYIGDIDALKARASLLNLNVPIVETDPEDANDGFDKFIPAIHMPTAAPVITGEPNPDNASAIIGAIDAAVDLAKIGSVSAVVTNPIAKSVLYASGFKHPGHTEYLASLAKDKDGVEPLPVMMLAGPQLRTVPVTIHIPLMSIMTHLTPELIVKTCAITAKDLSERFGIEKPRLAISGLNPHAGEDGALGHEDGKYIAPAIAQLQSMGIDATGPLPADTMFHEDARVNYDVAICMYHDQALIPAKALGFHDAVNVTLGLPFIRTSPDHGTAFSIAGKDIARPDSLIAALKMAGEMAQTHQRKDI
ncbi:MAG: 4-hydroxythreonine-4-phosphate dehydrogenase PdxA [Lentilitoribacter sp.]